MNNEKRHTKSFGNLFVPEGVCCICGDEATWHCTLDDEQRLYCADHKEIGWDWISGKEPEQQLKLKL